MGETYFNQFIQTTPFIQTSPSIPSLQEIIDDLCVRFILNCPEEEYESFERLFFQIEEAHWFYEDFYRENAKKSGYQLPALTLTAFAEKIFDNLPHLAQFRDAVENHIKSFWAYKSKVPVYGAIILNQSLDKVLLVKGFFSKTYSFPRGKINKDESEVACAIREVREEVGLDIEGLVNPDVYIMLTVREQPVKLFIVAGISEDVKCETLTRKEISSIEWHRIEDILGQTSSPRKSTKKYCLALPFVRQVSQWIKSRRTVNKPASPTGPVFQDNGNMKGKRRSQPQSPSFSSPKKRTQSFNDYPTTPSSSNRQQRKQSNDNRRKPSAPVSDAYSPPKYQTLPLPVERKAPQAGIKQAPSIMRSGERGLFNFSFNTDQILEKSNVFA